MAKVWYYRRGDEEVGPIDSATLRALAQRGELEQSDHVYREGLPDWVPAGRVKGLFNGKGKSGAESQDTAEHAAEEGDAAAADVPDELRMAAMEMFSGQPSRAGSVDEAAAAGDPEEPLAPDQPAEAAPPMDDVPIAGPPRDAAAAGDAPRVEPAASPAPKAAPRGGRRVRPAPPVRTGGWDAFFGMLRQIFDANTVAAMERALFAIGRWSLVLAALLVLVDYVWAAAGGASGERQPVMLFYAVLWAAVVLLLHGIVGKLRQVNEATFNASHPRISSTAPFEIAALLILLLAIGGLVLIVQLASAWGAELSVLLPWIFIAVGALLAAAVVVQPGAIGVRLEPMVTPGREVVGLALAGVKLLSRGLWIAFAGSAVLGTVMLAMALAARASEQGTAAELTRATGLSQLFTAVGTAAAGCVVLLVGNLIAELLLRWLGDNETR